MNSQIHLQRPASYLDGARKSSVSSMGAIWRTIRGYILWSYERGSLHYDIMVTLILFFVFVSPRFINYKDKPVERNPHPTGVVVIPDEKGGFIYQIQASAVNAAPGQDVRRQLERIIEPISGAVSVTRYEPVQGCVGTYAELQGLGGKGVGFSKCPIHESARFCRCCTGLLRDPGMGAERVARAGTVLSQMDTAAKNFRTTEANVDWDQYQKVIDETETQKGKIYFRREGGEMQMAADIVEPDKKYVLYSGGKVQVYQPKIDQVNEYSAGKNRSDDRELSGARFRRRRARPAEILRCEILGDGDSQRRRSRETGTDSEVGPLAKQYRPHPAVD